MRSILYFYADADDACQRTRRMLDEVVDEHDDVVLVAHDIGTPTGRRAAQRSDVTSVPTIVVDGDRVIRGEPTDPEQILPDPS